MSKTLEEMKAELEAAGYLLDKSTRFGHWDETVEILAPDGWQHYVSYDTSSLRDDEYEAIETQVWKEARELAYAHLQQQQEHAAMKAFVNQVAFGVFIGNEHHKAKTLMLLKRDARALLAELEAKQLLGKE